MEESSELQVVCLLDHLLMLAAPVGLVVWNPWSDCVVLDQQRLYCAWVIGKSCFEDVCSTDDQLLSVLLVLGYLSSDAVALAFALGS
jgi:hypothetical protein